MVGNNNNNNSNELRCLLLNMRGFGNINEKRQLKNKFNKLRQVIYENKSNIIFVNELCTKHDSNKLDEINFNELFDGFKCIRTGNETAILIDHNIQNRVIEIPKNIKLNGNQWTVYTKITTRENKEILLCSYYRSPSRRPTDRSNRAILADPRLLKRELDYIKHNEGGWDSIIICGDFNIEHIYWDERADETKCDKYAKSVFKLMDEYDLDIINDRFKPTHAKLVNIIVLI